jgi:hypothetical protein
MRIRFAPKPAPRPAFKPAPKPARKPTPKPTPKPAQLDLIRNPNFDSAMAQQNYANFMADQQARLAAQQGQYTQGRLMGAPTNQPIQSRVPMGFSTYDEAGIPEDQRKILDRVPMGFSTYDKAGIPEDQKKILDDEMAKIIAEQSVELPNIKKAGEVAIGGTPDKPIYGSMAGPVYADGTLVDATNQQAQNYQNFLQQGIQRSNTMNQDAATNFANSKPSAPTMQPAIPSRKTAQPRNLPRPSQPKGFGSPIGRSAF